MICLEACAAVFYEPMATNSFWKHTKGIFNAGEKPVAGVAFLPKTPRARQPTTEPSLVFSTTCAQLSSKSTGVVVTIEV
jgi:hypothetical protein